MNLKLTEQGERVRHGKHPIQPGARPYAYAIINGSEEYPSIKGVALFFKDGGGTWVQVQVNGLPGYQPETATATPIGPFGLHIHDKGNCTPYNTEKPFDNAMGHYNPTRQPHGNHAGDFPVLFSNDGYARMSFFTNKFTPDEIINKSIMIHLNPDDYRTEPAGNSGKRIACGVIKKFQN